MKAIMKDEMETGIAISPKIDRWINSPQTITMKEMNEIPNRTMMMMSFVSVFIDVSFYFHYKDRINK